MIKGLLADQENPAPLDLLVHVAMPEKRVTLDYLELLERMEPLELPASLVNLVKMDHLVR